MIGLIIANHTAIPNDIVMIAPKFSLNPSSANKNARKIVMIRSRVFLLYLSATSPVKKFTRYGSLITPNRMAISDKVRLFAIATIGIKRNQT
ncbi:hypothetical protein GW864_02480 [bacterium]|nr:hypothetical protein [bacterium]